MWSSGWRRAAFSSQALAATGATAEAVPWTTVTGKQWTLLLGGRPQDRAELYSLREDPAQSKNIIRKNAPVARRLHEQLVRFLEDVGTEPEKLAGVSKLRT